MLCGLGLQLFGGCYVGNIGEVHAQAVLAQLPSELSHGFEKWLRLDVANSAADFGDYEVVVAGVSEEFHTALYFIGDVGYNLDCLAKIISTAFLVDDALEHAATRHIIGARCAHVGKPFVVAEVEVGLVAVFGNIAFTVLVGVECARVDIDVGVEFLDCYPESTGFQKTCKRRRYYAFAQRRNYATCDKYVLCVHCFWC